MDSSILGNTQPTNPARSGDNFAPGDNRLPRCMSFQYRRPSSAMPVRVIKKKNTKKKK